MAFNVSIIGWILCVTSFAVMESAVARGLFLAPMASQDAASTIKSQSDIILEWLKITAVPLGVFLMGACTWDCIKNLAAWRSITERRGNPSDTSGGDEVRPERLNNSSGADGSDHVKEAGMALSKRRTDIDDTAISVMSAAETVIPMQAAPLQSPNGDGNCRPTSEVAPDHNLELAVPYSTGALSAVQN